MKRLWWEKWPERLEDELKRLQDARIPFQIDEAARQKGVLRIHLKVKTASHEIGLIATFPDLYPYFRFEVAAPELSLNRHQHPFSKHLCLIGRSTSNWLTSDTLAAFITERFPRLLPNYNPEEAEIEEEDQGEPFTDFYSYLKDSIVLIDSGWNLEDVSLPAKFVMRFSTRADGIQGFLEEVRDASDKVLGTFKDLSSLFPEKITGHWTRISEPPADNNAQRILDDLRHKNLIPKNLIVRGLSNGWRISIVGVVFQEEVRKNEFKDAWLFILQIGTKKENQTVFLRSGRAGRSDLLSRIKEEINLGEKKVAIIGVGALGSSIAVELARIGVGELQILDFDAVEPGNVPRWAIGMTAVGLSKCGVLKAYVQSNYPYTKVTAIPVRIGEIKEKLEEISQLETLLNLVTEVDLVIDTSTEVGVHHILSDLTRELKRKYLIAFSTPGVWGGLVGKFEPGGRTGCWLCLQHALYVEKIIPEPPYKEDGLFQPLGCANPTFTGTSLDLGEVSLQACRTARSMLEANDYSKRPETIDVLSLVDSHGLRQNPSWSSYMLSPNRACICQRQV